MSLASLAWVLLVLQQGGLLLGICPSKDNLTLSTWHELWCVMYCCPIIHYLIWRLMVSLISAVSRIKVINTKILYLELNGFLTGISALKGSHA
jgi:hypothetical protein